MEILCSSINFHPDHSGIALYSTDLPAYLSERSHRVTMVTGFPYYPSWEKRKGDRGALWRREKFGKVDVLRGYLYVPRRPTALRRIVQDLSFVTMSTVNFLRAGRHDLIVVLTPPFLLGLAGLLFRKMWGARLVIHVQDLQLEAALSLGMLRKGPLMRAVAKLDRFVLSRSDLVVTITPGMRETLAAQGVPREKLAVVPNWIDVDDTARRGRRSPFLERYPGVRGKFTVAYAGNIGVKQGVDVLVDLAERTRGIEGIHYFIIGEGADRERILLKAREMELRNLTFHAFLSQEEYYGMLRDIDVVFIAQRPGPGNVFFPSKLLGVMALSKPVLVAAEGNTELARFVTAAGCGLVAEPGDIEGLRDNLLRLHGDGRELRRAGEASLSAVRRYHREAVLSRYMGMMQALCAEEIPPGGAVIEPSAPGV